MSTSLPDLPGVVVHRPRLSQLLDDAMNRPVTLLTAPPGWGKTSTVRSWLDHRAETGPVTWLSLDPADPRGGELTDRIAGITAATAAGVVVIDDVHLGDAGTIADTLAPWTSPADNRIRLILSTRDDSALPVPRWRLGDQVAEVGCPELAFTLDETAHVLAVQEVTLPTPEVEALHTRTEGWPAGVRFAALRAGSTDPLAEERHEVARYVEADVLGRLPAGVRDLLVRTSVLDQLCGDLADALALDGDGGNAPAADAVLAELAAAGGFVLALGGTPAWYRYHHQFREVLRDHMRRTRPHQEALLHARAAAWLSEHDLPMAAMRHARASGEGSGGDLAGAVVRADWADLALAGCQASPSDPRPATAVRPDDPDLTVSYVVDRIGHGDVRAADDGLSQLTAADQSTMDVRALWLARDRLAGDLARITASATALLAAANEVIPANEDTRAGGAIDADGVIDAADPRRIRVRAVALAARAAALLGAGDLDATADTLAEAQPGLEVAPADAASARPTVPACARRTTTGVRALLAAVSGDLRGAERGARASLAMPPCQGRPRDVHGEPAYLALAVISHEWSRPAEARRFLDLAARARRLTAEPELAAWHTLVDAWLRGARGEHSDAVDALTAAGPGVAAAMRPWFVAAEAHMRIAHGDTRTARATLAPLLAGEDEDEGEGADGGGAGRAMLAVEQARALLRDGDPHAAARELPAWSHDSPAGTVLSVRLDAGLVEARAARAMGDRRRATQALERVLELAQAQGFRGPFTRPGTDDLRDLLAEHLDSGTAHWSTVTALLDRPDPVTQPGPAGAEALTEREVTVLRYLQSMLSNEEIAARLFVSVNTVKTHVRHIYRKLEVSQRRDAVRRARHLRLL